MIAFAIAQFNKIPVAINNFTLNVMKLLYPSSVTKQQLQQQQHVYDCVMTKPVTHNHSVKKVSSNNNNIVMDENPAYDKGTLFTNECIKANEDVEYEVVDPQSRQTKTDDIKVDKNPAYVETRFNS